MGKSAHGADSNIPVVCAICGTRMYAAASEIGNQVRCPDCHTKTTVEPVPEALAPPEPQYSGSEYQLQDDPSSQPSKDSYTYTPVACRVCNTRMNVRIEHVGKRVKCPDCGAPNLVSPPAAKKHDFKMPDVSDVTLDTPPPPIETARQQIADRLMEKAHEQHEEQQSTEPQPKSPLETKLLHFVFRLKIVPLWIGLTAGILAIWALIDVINSMMEGLSLVSGLLAIFTSIITAMVGALVGGIAIPQLIAITSFTSEGHDRIPYWPSHDLLDRMWALMFAVNAGAMAAAPGMVLATILRPLGIPIWAGLLPFLFFFPFVVLSMMEANSVFIPYSPKVRKTFASHRHGCNRFYLQSCGLAAIFTFAIASAWMLHPMIGRVVLAVTMSIYAVIYAHLLGRLAWILGEPESDDGIDQLNAELESAD